MNPEGNEGNLIPVTERTKEEARIMSQNGGIASGIARREKKTMRERLKELMDMKIDGSDLTYGEAILQKQITRSLDLKEGGRATEWIVDNVEGKLKDTIDHQGAVILNFDKKLEKL